jgi:hypothetical protein
VRAAVTDGVKDRLIIIMHSDADAGRGRDELALVDVATSAITVAGAGPGLFSEKR